MGATVVPLVLTIYKNAAGDKGVTKTVTVVQSDGKTAKDITGLTITLKIWDGDPAQPLLTSSNVANDGTPADGIVIWTLTLTDINALPVSYTGLKAELQFTSGGSVQDTTDPFTVVVKPVA